MAHGPIFCAQSPDITCRKIQEILSEMLLIELRNLSIYLQTLDRFSCYKSLKYFSMSREHIFDTFILQTDVTSIVHRQKGLPKDYWLKLNGSVSSIAKWWHFIQNFIQVNIPYIYIKTDFVKPG